MKKLVPNLLTSLMSAFAPVHGHSEKKKSDFLRSNCFDHGDKERVVLLLCSKTVAH